MAGVVEHAPVGTGRVQLHPERGDRSGHAVHLRHPTSVGRPAGTGMLVVLRRPGGGTGRREHLRAEAEYPTGDVRRPSTRRCCRWPTRHGRRARPYDYHWHGLMGYTRSRLRMIGAEPRNPVLLYNLGCNGVGFMPSIYGGQRIARMLAGDDLGPSIFDPPDDHQSRMTLPHSPRPTMSNASSNVVGGQAMGDDAADVETALQHGGHLVPGLEDAPAVDALDLQALEDHVVHVERHRPGGDAEHRDAPAVVHRVEHLVERRLGTATSPGRRRSPRSCPARPSPAPTLLGDVDHPRGAVRRGHRQPVRVDVGDHDVAGADVARRSPPPARRWGRPP